MKIEKVNDNQIRCTLTREDLASRELKLSELAYGTEKAKNLFRDMMQQANFEFGFEAEDIPLMIEAIPLNAECIVLIITKVEDPEELDTRFSRFAPSGDEEEDYEDYDSEDNDSKEITDLFHRIQDAKKTAEDTAPKPAAVRVFRFPTLQAIMNAAVLVKERYQGSNTLYKDETGDAYLLVLTPGEGSPEDYDRTCNILSEYGTLKRMSSLGKSYFEEHYEPLIADNALQSLSQI
ncbi:MAG: adaptor protein MecA [Roseburia sp.]|nr:adaptor protein MecA [Roseburia sp.]